MTTQTPGIYHVVGIANIPFQIVITSELVGDEYAACRALTDKAAEDDIVRVVEDSGREQNDVIRAYYRTMIRLVAEKNPEVVIKIRGRLDAMDSILMEIMKDEVDKKVNSAVSAAVSNAVTETRQEDHVSAIRNIMDSFGVGIDRAMETMKIPPSQQDKYASLVRKMG